MPQPAAGSSRGYPFFWPAYEPFGILSLVKGLGKSVLLFWVLAVFLGGAVNMFPCAAGAENPQAGKKACHQTKNLPEKKDSKTSDKPCCSLHCYNPASITPLVTIAPPATAATAIENDSLTFFSLILTPLIPPPQS